MKQHHFFIVVILLFVSVLGCNGFVPIGGKVTYSDDGTPLNAGIVAFTDGQVMARGILKSDGEYQLSSLKTNDGLRPGTYQVYIFEAQKQIGVRHDDGAPIFEPLIDEKYSHHTTSGLSVEIKKSTRRFDLSVDRYVSKKKKK